MFERIGREPDPEGWVRRVVAAVFLVSVVLCAGTLAAIEWITWILLRLGWELLRWLLAWWFGVSVPPLWVFEPPELTVVAVTLDTPMVWDDRWDEGPPEPPLPTLHPREEPLPPPPEVRLAVLDEVVESVGLLMLIGTTGGESAAIADLWSDEVGLGSIDSALSGGLIGVVGTDGGISGGLGLSGGLGTIDREARVVRLADPRWPDDAVGSCTVAVAVDRRGKGTVDGWLDCDPGLRRVIEEAVRRSTFDPAVRDGVEVDGVIEVRFRP